MFGYAFDLLWRWLVTTLAILMVPAFVSSVKIEGIGTALAAAAILGVLNVLLRPVLIILTLPITVLSFGLFLLFINAFLFVVAGWIVHGMVVESFWGAFVASLIVSLVSWLLSWRWPWDRRAMVGQNFGADPNVWVFRSYWNAPQGGKKRPSSSTVELKKNQDGSWE